MKQLNFPTLRQTYEWDCGAKALQAVLVYYGIKVREELIIKYAKTIPKIGTLRSNMLKTLDKFDLKYNAGKLTIQDLKQHIDNNSPIIILLQAWSDKNTDYNEVFSDSHWVVVIGYDKNKFLFEDPYSFEKTYLINNELKKRWHAKENGKEIFNYGIAVCGKKPNFNSKKTVHMD